MKIRSSIFTLFMLLALAACRAKPTPVPFTFSTEPPFEHPRPLTVVNHSSAPVDVFMVDIFGREFRLTPQHVSGYAQTTLVVTPGLLYRIRDLQGNLVLEFVASAEEQQTITVPTSPASPP